VAIQLVNGLLPQHPAVIMGFSVTAECGAVIPIVNVAGPLTYCFSPVVQPQRGSYVFSTSVSTEYIIPVMIKFARERGYRKIAMIDATDATGQASERTVAATLDLPANQSLRVVAAEHFNPSDVSVAAQVANLKAADPDIVFTFASGPAFGNVLRSMHDAGMNVPVGASAANMNYEQLAQYAAFLPKELLFNGFRYQESSNIRGPLRVQMDTFLKAFRATSIRPTPVQAFAWDPAMLVVDALQKLGPSATATQLRDYFETLHGEVGLNGVYDFRSGNQHGLTDTAVIVVRWDGRTSEFIPVSGPGGSPLAPGASR
jgi:branched-chain amino acid transport system substrate-binding protein